MGGTCSCGYLRDTEESASLFDAELGGVYAPTTEQCVVISPLVSLMVDHISSLQLSGVEANWQY